ncbi:MAG: YceI family protein [Cyclobacteriaceae bacterium]|nr:YceI family protein [Cyclobacteriaceae bacterium]
MKKLFVLAAALVLTVSAKAQGTWVVDNSHSNIGFSVAHMVVSEQEGNFKDYSIKVVTNAADFNGADVEFTAKSASINTENEKRDGHLASADFFDADKYPEVSFKGKLSKEGGKYVLKGNLTMKGVTKPVTFDVTYGGTVKAWGKDVAGFKLSGKVNRQDYGLTWSKTIETGGLVVGDEVTINCKIELNKQS